jgi:hypothetical protein
MASAAPIIVPIGSSIMASDGAKTSSIALGAPDSFYAREVDVLPLPEYRNQTLQGKYYYIGRQDGYTFVAHDTPLAGWAYLKIHESKLRVDAPFPLTARKERWREMDFGRAYVADHGEGLEWVNPPCAVSAALHGPDLGFASVTDRGTPAARSCTMPVDLIHD